MKLIQCVDDFLQTLNMDDKRQRIPTDTLPDLNTVSYQDIKTWCAANRVDPCVLQSVSKPTVSRDTGEKAIIHIIDIYHHAFYYGSDIQRYIAEEGKKAAAPCSLFCVVFISCCVSHPS